MNGLALKIAQDSARLRLGGLSFVTSFYGNEEAKFPGQGFPRGKSGLLTAYRDDGRRFVVHADEKLTAFIELESAIRACRELT